MYFVFQWLDASWLSSTIRSSTYAFAVIECFHLLGMVCLLGPILVIDLRLLDLSLRRQPLSKLAGALTPVILLGGSTMLVTGALLVSSEALKCYDNPAFFWKMTLLVASMVFFFTVHQRITRPERAGINSRLEKLVGLISLGLWFGIALAGRAIAFV